MELAEAAIVSRSGHQCRSGMRTRNACELMRARRGRKGAWGGASEHRQPQGGEDLRDGNSAPNPVAHRAGVRNGEAQPKPQDGGGLSPISGENMRT